MGLYLCIFDENDEEIDGLEVGSYEDYGHFIEAIVRELECGLAGSRYPALTLHSDSDGEWSAQDCAVLVENLQEIGNAFRKLPPVSFKSDWQLNVAQQLGLPCRSLYDAFIDVDGEPLISRLTELCRESILSNRPISFQ